MQRDIAHDPKSFWTYINSKKRSGHIPNTMFLNDTQCDTGRQICDAFAKHFNGVYSSNYDLNNSISDRIFADQVSLCEIDDAMVVDAIRKLKVGKAIGPDGVPSYIIKGLIDVFRYPLRSIFNLSLKTNMFPEQWKKVKVCPIHKKGSKNDIKNYRPVAVLSSVAKIFESILFEVIYTSVSSTLSVHQHGFLRGKSTVTGLMCAAGAISEALNRRSQVDMVYTDFAKAFDVVSHPILVQKLGKQFGFHHNLLNLISSYLGGRQHRVEVRGHVSDYFVPTSGVPQGSNLGPLMFLMFIDDIILAINGSDSNIKLFADDLKLYREILTVEDCIALQLDVDKLVKWSQDNKMYFNISKCAVLTYTRKERPVEFTYSMEGDELARVREMRDLGVTFDSQLTYNKHVELICNKASQMHGFIVRNARVFSDVQCVRTLYISFVRSILEYCSQIWSPFYQCHKYSIEKIQMKVLRYMYYRETGIYDCHMSSDHLLLRYEFVSLEKRRKIADLVYLWKIARGCLSDSECLEMLTFNVPTYNTRVLNTFYLSRMAHSNNYLNSPVYRICNLYNSVQLDCDLFNTSLKAFKAIIASKL